MRICILLYIFWKITVSSCKVTIQTRTVSGNTGASTTLHRSQHCSRKMPAASTSTKYWGLQIQSVHIVEKNIFMLEDLQVWLIPIYAENERSAAKDSIFCFSLPYSNTYQKWIFFLLWGPYFSEKQTLLETRALEAKGYSTYRRKEFCCIFLYWIVCCKTKEQYWE